MSDDGQNASKLDIPLLCQVIFVRLRALRKRCCACASNWISSGQISVGVTLMYHKRGNARYSQPQTGSFRSSSSHRLNVS